MSRETFQAAGENLEFNFYHGGLHGRPVVAAKVKCYLGRITLLRPGFARKLNALAEKEPSIVEKIEGWAWESCVETWWEWAHERARDLGIGEIESMGRSGGWLGLSKFTRDYVRNLCNVVSLECGHCGLPFTEHADGKCLFDHVEYTTNDPDTVELLHNIIAFVDECEASVSGPAADRSYVDEMEAFIDVQWEAMRSAESSR